MSDYTLNWDSANIDGTNNFSTGGGDSVSVDVSTPPNAGGRQWGLHGQVGQGSLEIDFPGPGAEAQVDVDFNEDVANVTFKLYDVDGNYDGGSLNWDDRVTINAFDSLGNPVAVIYTDVDGQDITGNTIEGNADFNVHSYVTVSFAGPVASFSAILATGGQAAHAGYVGISDISFDEYVASCFVRGTMIETNRGEVAVEALTADDMVRTADNGFQPIRWIGSTRVTAKGRNAPILFRKGAIGNTRDLLLSPAHRVMLQGWQTEVLFGTGELLASARSLVNDSTILRQVVDEDVEYFHILFDRHEIIFSEGAPTESFHPGEASAGTMAADTRAEILSLFPELVQDHNSYGPSARGTLHANEAALLSL